MRASGASELRKCSHFHIQKLLFPLYSVGTLDTLFQKHIYFQAVSFYYTYGMALYINVGIPTKH